MLWIHSQIRDICICEVLAGSGAMRAFRVTRVLGVHSCCKMMIIVVLCICVRSGYLGWKEFPSSGDTWCLWGFAIKLVLWKLWIYVMSLGRWITRVTHMWAPGLSTMLYRLVGIHRKGVLWFGFHRMGVLWLTLHILEVLCLVTVPGCIGLFSGSGTPLC